MNSSAENIWETFWTVAAAISGLGLPGAILLLMICYLVVFLRWICRDSSFTDALSATKPGRRLWLKLMAGTGLSLFVLNLPYCSLEVIRYGLIVASLVCIISIFSNSLRESTKLSEWPFWTLAFFLTGSFDFLIWLYARSSNSAAGLESFFPFIELLMIGAGYFAFLRLPSGKAEIFPLVALRLVFCSLSLLCIHHSSVQLGYFLSYRAQNFKMASSFLSEEPVFPVSSALIQLTEKAPPRPGVSPREEKILKERVDFESDLARIIAFFLGFGGFNAIFVVASRHFGLRDAKSIPALARFGGVDSAPTIPESIRSSIFFPNRRYRRGHRMQLFFLALSGNLFVSAVTVFSSSRGGFFHFVLSFLAYTAMLYPPISLGCANGYRLAAYRARSSLRGVKILMNTPDYKPMDVLVRRPTLLQRIQHKITGSWIRHAVDRDGRLYSLMFGRCSAEEFPAQLYRLRSGIWNESLTGRQAFVALPKHEGLVRPLRNKRRA